MSALSSNDSKNPTASGKANSLFLVSEKSYSNQPVGLGSQLSDDNTNVSLGRAGAERDARAAEPILIPSVNYVSEQNGSRGRPARRHMGVWWHIKRASWFAHFLA